MKIVRILLSIVLLFLVVAALALGALYYFVDPDKLKPLITTEVKKQTGYVLSMDDKLSWAIYPRIAIYVPKMTLTAPGETKAFANLQGASAAVDVAQLLRGNGRLLGNISIANLELMGLHFSNVKTILRWQENRLSLNPVKASFYQGSLSGGAGANFANQSDVPNWSWNVTLNHVQFKPLMADLNPDSKLVISGVSDLRMRATARGKSRSQIIVSLNGDAVFDLNDGAIDGIDLNYLVRSADALINKQALPEPPEVFKTDFSSLRGTVVIANGIATISSAQLTSPAFVTKGQGEIDLMSSAVDMKLTIVPQVSAKTQWNVPVIVDGTLSHPRVGLDSGQIAKYAIKQQIDNVKDKARDAIKKHVSGEAGEYLQKLLGR